MLIISSELKYDFKYINTTDISANSTCTNLYTFNVVGFVITTLLQISTVSIIIFVICYM